MRENLAPIVLFVYNRLEHAQRTVEALQKNLLAKESELFIFSDGPKREGDIEEVNRVRKYVQQIAGFKNITITEREKNYGLAQSIVSGVTEIISRYGKVIVLEDDLVTDQTFLTYMNEGLNKYQNMAQVYSITGYSYLDRKMENVDTFFLKVCSSWSWATWVDRWEKYDSSCAGWEELKRDRSLRKAFDYDYSYPYYSLLNSQMTDDKTNSWAIKWYWAIFKNEGLVLYPSSSLVNNIGFDGSGEHCNEQQKNYQKFVENSSGKKLEYEDKIVEKIEIRKQIVKAIYRRAALGQKIQILRDKVGI